MNYTITRASVQHSKRAIPKQIRVKVQNDFRPTPPKSLIETATRMLEIGKGWPGFKFRSSVSSDPKSSPETDTAEDAKPPRR
jgi:hypothetical protein